MKKFRRRSARMNLMHYRVLVARYFRQIFSSLGTLLPLVLQAPVMLVIVWLVSQKDAFTLKSPDALTGANVTLFMLVIMSALMGILNSYREICKERDVLSREVFGGLDVSAYALSKFCVLALVGIVQCSVLLFGTALYSPFNFSAPVPDFLLCLAALILTNLSVTAIGLFLSALLKKSESAILPVLLIIIMQVVFSDGVLVLDGAAGYIKYITPSAWGIAVFGNVCGLNGWLPAEIFHRAMFGYSPLISLAALALLTILFVFLTVFVLKRRYRGKE